MTSTVTAPVNSETSTTSTVTDWVKSETSTTSTASAATLTNTTLASALDSTSNAGTSTQSGALMSSKVTASTLSYSSSVSSSSSDTLSDAISTSSLPSLEYLTNSTASPVTNISNSTTTSVESKSTAPPVAKVSSSTDAVTRSGNATRIASTASGSLETSSVISASRLTTKTDNSIFPPTISGSFQNSTFALSNQTEATQLTAVDCSKVIGISVTVSVCVWVVTVLLFLICLVRMRQKWKWKLQEERRKTDIWSLHTYNNTIINDNFLDFKLAPANSRGNRRSSDIHTARLKQARLSGGALSRASSCYNDDYSFRRSILRRSTMSDDERSRFARTKTKTKRQLSNLSANVPSGYWRESSSSAEMRPRTSTFTIGKRDKHDKHVLVNHDELRMSGGRYFDDGMDMVEIQTGESGLPEQGPPYFVTEL